MMARGRLLAVLTVLAVGAIGVISSTQTWLVAILDDGGHRELAVTGAAAVPVLSPLSLAVLALGAALSIVGLVLRYAFGALTVLIAAAIGYLTVTTAYLAPDTAVASTITEATGITGSEALDSMITSVTVTPWPFVTLIASVLLFVSGILTLTTAKSWQGSGRKYRSDAAPHAAGEADPTASRPFDSIDSWDDLSRGSDPTADPKAGPGA